MNCWSLIKLKCMSWEHICISLKWDICLKFYQQISSVTDSSDFGVLHLIAQYSSSSYRRAGRIGILEDQFILFSQEIQLTVNSFITFAVVSSFAFIKLRFKHWYIRNKDKTKQRIMPASKSSSFKSTHKRYSERNILNLNHSFDSKKNIYTTSYNENFGKKKGASWSAGSMKYPVIPPITQRSEQASSLKGKRNISKSESALNSFSYDDSVFSSSQGSCKYP